MQISNVKSLMNTIKVAPLAILIAGATNACVEVGVNYRTQSQSNAAKYLSGKEFLDAKKHVIENNLYNATSKSFGLEEEVYYLDSLLTEAKAKEAYFKGMQMVKDSVDGKPYHRPEFKIPVDTTFENISPKDDGYTRAILDELAEYKTGREMEEIIKEMPGTIHGRWETECPELIHYFNTLASIGAQKEAFNKGVDAQKALMEKK